MTRLMHRFLEESALVQPDRPAVADRDSIVTYAELDEQANRIAHLLGQLGVQKGDLTGVLIEKSAVGVAALYGIMKAGAAYVPLDAKAPTARLTQVAENAGFTVLLTARSRLSRALALVDESSASMMLVVLDDDAPTVPDVSTYGAESLRIQPAVGRDLELTESDLAYVLYTSGSTGVPKGVALSHGNGAAFVNWAVETLDLGPEDRLSSHAPFHFDLSVFDIYASAASGACVYLVPASLSLFPLQLARFIEEKALTVWYSVPTVLNSLAEHGQLQSGALNSLRTIVFAGEVFPTPALCRLMEQVPDPDYWNWYGPTETNVCAAFLLPGIPADDNDIPIGRPIVDTEALIVDSSGALVNDGNPGELLICGPTVTGGYWHDPDRTDAAFVPHPRMDGMKAYRTGDLVIRDSNQDLTFVGRIDDQIKTRGNRVDLGDVETVLRSFPTVVEAAVVAVADQEISNVLHAFVVLQRGAEVKEVLQHVRKQLPSYMIPASITVVEALARTPNLKIDRRALISEAQRRADGSEAGRK